MIEVHRRAGVEWYFQPSLDFSCHGQGTVCFFFGFGSTGLPTQADYAGWQALETLVFILRLILVLWRFEIYSIWNLFFSDLPSTTQGSDAKLLPTLKPYIHFCFSCMINYIQVLKRHTEPYYFHFCWKWSIIFWYKVTDDTVIKCSLYFQLRIGYRSKILFG